MIDDSVNWSFEEAFQLHPKQKMLMRQLTKKRLIYWGGARAGGKTHATVAACTYIALKYPGIRIAYVRKTVKEMTQDIVHRFLERIPNYIARYYKSTGDIVFNNHENPSKCSRINFVSIENASDVEKERGIERQFYVVDEANLFGEDVIMKLRGSLRNTRIPNWNPVLLQTGNPGGVSDPYFKKYYINPNYADWTPEELEEKDDYLFIQATVQDNPTVMEKDPAYIRFLKSLPKHLYAAWYEGRWDSFQGQFFEEWSDSIHVVEKEFAVPSNWTKWRGIDFGRGNHPSVCLWLAQDPNTGYVYVYREWAYTGQAIEDFVRGIISLSPGDEQISQNFADPAGFATDNTVYDMRQYFEPDIVLDKADNSRQIGWRNLKQWLHWTWETDDSPAQQPMLRIFKSCTGLIKTIPTLQYHKRGIEDLNTQQQDDYADALRYATSHLQYGYIYNGYDYTKMHSRQLGASQEWDDSAANLFEEVDSRHQYDIRTPYNPFGSGDEYYVRDDRDNFVSIYSQF